MRWVFEGANYTLRQKNLTVKTPVFAQDKVLREKLNNFLTAYRNENLKIYSERANKTQFGNEAAIITSVVNMVKIDF